MSNEEKVIWTIHGKKYDLTPYIESGIQPGGLANLELATGQGEAGHIFETFRAFSSAPLSDDTLALYEVALTVEEADTDDEDVNKPRPVQSFTSYHKLVEQVKKQFPNYLSIKANWQWYGINTLLLYLYFNVFWSAMFSTITLYRCIFAVSVGMFEISLYMNLQRPAAAFSVSVHPETNRLIAKIGNAWALGGDILDRLPPVQYSQLIQTTQQFIVDRIPHEYSDQVDEFYDLFITYVPVEHVIKIFWYYVKSLTNSTTTYYDQTDKYIISLKLFCLLWFFGPLATMCYAMTLNYGGLVFRKIQYITQEQQYPPGTQEKYGSFSSINYVTQNGNKLKGIQRIGGGAGQMPPSEAGGINRGSPHEAGDLGEPGFPATQETHQNEDWLKEQIMNTKNYKFVTLGKEYTGLDHTLNLALTKFFGYVNYPIENTLFPNMCPVHYPKVFAILKTYCVENEIAYTEQYDITEKLFDEKEKME